MSENNNHKAIASQRSNNFAVPEAVIFDMDGTLVATTEADFLAWQKVFVDRGKQLTFDDYFPLLGKKSHDVVSHVLNLTGSDADTALKNKMRYFEEIVAQKGIAKMPHAETILKQLKSLNIPMALATSSRKLKMDLVLEEVGLLDYFDVLVSGEEVIHGKPDPDIFLLAASRLKAAPQNCVVLEDAVSGVMAAKAAGMKCIAVTNTHGAEDLFLADLVITDFSELSMSVISSLF